MIKPGDILEASDETIEFCYDKFGNDRWLVYGFACQLTHDKVLTECGVKYELYDDYHPWDRTIRGYHFDDKLALLDDNLVPAKTHTISRYEKPVWDKLDKIFVNSFEQFDPYNKFRFRYVRTFDYKKLKIHPTKHYGGTFYFWRS